MAGSSVYVLPAPAAVFVPAETVSLRIAVKHDEVLQVFAPPSPPPKASLL